MIKRFPFLLPALLAISAASCNKVNDAKCALVTTTASSAEVAQLQAYISSNGITAQADGRGFFYTIVRPGAGARPTACSDVTVAYTGRLTSGQQFDASSGVTFNLSRLIVGWQEALPLIGQGGSIILYLPPGLAYGSVAQSSIPANSITVFSIDLVKVE